MNLFRGKSNEEKFVHAVCELKKEDVDKDTSSFGKFERMRQTWINEKNKDVLSKRAPIIEDDIAKVEKSVKDSSAEVLETKEYETYIKALKGILELERRFELEENDEKFEQTKESYESARRLLNQLAIFNQNINNYVKAYRFIYQKLPLIVSDRASLVDITKTQEALKSITEQTLSPELLKNCAEYLEFMKDQFKSGESKVSSVKLSPKIDYWNQTSKLRMQITRWMDSFYTELAEKVFDKYKKIFDLAMKCNRDKVKKVLPKQNEKKITYTVNMSSLICIAVDAKKDKYANQIRNFQIENLM